MCVLHTSKDELNGKAGNIHMDPSSIGNIHAGVRILKDTEIFPWLNDDQWLYDNGA